MEFASESSSNMGKHALLTGGTGFIGSHTAIAMLTIGWNVTLIDNLYNSTEDMVARIVSIAQCDPSRVRFIQVDIRHLSELEEKVFKVSPKFDSCIHFAGLKAVGESVSNPIKYFDNNIVGSVNLLKLLDIYECRSLIFSSSCTVYGSAIAPFNESTLTGVGITNPYGRTKFFLEEMLKDVVRGGGSGQGSAAASSNPWRIILLRYFNPVGAHESGEIGEDPKGIPNNLCPFIGQVLCGMRDQLTVFGYDYPGTVNGTPVRDYIHVMDIAEGHVAAIDYLEKQKQLTTMSATEAATAAVVKEEGHRITQGQHSLFIFNLGTGKGVSVLEMIAAMEQASGLKVKYLLGPRRDGDVAASYASVDLAKEELGWVAKRDLTQICRDMWNWQMKFMVAK